MSEHNETYEEELVEMDIEQMDFSDTEEPMEVALPKARIAYIMAIVAVMCGGNGIGILLAGLYWKATQNLPGSIGIAVGVTAVALILVLLIVLFKKHLVKKKLKK